MARVLTNFHRNIALEVARGERSVAYVTLDGAQVALSKMDKREFDKEFYRPCTSPQGVEYTPRQLARHYLGLKHYPLEAGAVAAMVDEMALATGESRPLDDVALLCNTQTGLLVGQYESAQDARLVQEFVSGTQLVRVPDHMKGWKQSKIDALRLQVAPNHKVKSTGVKLLEGVIKMAKSAAKPAAPVAAAKKVAKVAKERVERKEGPLYVIQQYVIKNESALRSGKMTMLDCRKALEAQGLSKSTVGVQLGRRFKELGIAVVRAKKEKPVKAAKAEATKAIAKAAKPAKTTTVKAAKAAVAKKDKPAKASKAAKEEEDVL